MSSRISARTVAPGVYQALRGLERYVSESGLEPALLELVRLRASQLNGCAFCLDMHAKALRALGESERRLYVLSAWRDAPFYTEREQAALTWTEAVTKLSDGEVPDEVYQAARREFGDKGLVDLTLAVIAINSWNRLNIAFRNPPPAE